MDHLTPVMVAVTRLCHDLAGPLGALESGTSLLEEDCADGQPLDPEICALLKDSATSGALRLRLVRFTLGLSGSGSSASGTPAALLGACLSPAHRALVWSGADVQDRDATDIRLLTLAVLGCADLWPSAPAFRLCRPAPDRFEIAPDRSGACGPFRGELRERLDRPPETANVFLWFAAGLARERSVTLQWPEDGSAPLRLTFPGTGPGR
ncbi:hypothetical protein IHV25_03620 [Phaeovibrio sulfidiphilus]|uniref:Histidine phosphotransferase ChpT C-terminal domain-containing protein n=1 Tax=Phaeovibrio sulfidiphilus TaxID=1220600 RepID=A0A8J6YI91_9PROT|nr:hypothetical protein [Phaeovibrio sulfidiphilus]MBE1236741.1 hypothetical protein [Phaeovibrio sulfidiphilus]